MSKQKNPCLFGCQRFATRNSDMCSVCKAGLRYWDDKPHSDILKREEHLEVLANRMHRLASTGRRKARPAVRARARARVGHEARV